MRQYDSESDRILELAIELQTKSASFESAEDLESLLPTIQDIKSIVDQTISRLREAFESPEWSAWLRDRKEATSGTDYELIDSIYDAGSKIVSRIENTYQKSQLLSVELGELGKALRALIPIYRLGKETYASQEESEVVIREACDDIGNLLQDSFGFDTGEE